MADEAPKTKKPAAAAKAPVVAPKAKAPAKPVEKSIAPAKPAAAKAPATAQKAKAPVASAKPAAPKAAPVTEISEPVAKPAPAAKVEPAKKAPATKPAAAKEPAAKATPKKVASPKKAVAKTAPKTPPKKVKPVTKSAKPAASTKAIQDEAETIAARLTEGTREFVKRSAETAKERTENMYDASQRYNADLEGFLVRAAKGYVNVLGSIADAAYANMNHTYATAEKLAEAKTVSEAVQIQSEFLRERTNNNMENIRSSFDYLRDTVATSNTEMREAAAKMWNGDKAA